MSDSDHEHNAARDAASGPDASAVSGERPANKQSGVEGIAVTEFQPDGKSWIGRVLDERYRVTEVLGEGGMGAVYVAEHLKLHKQVALKVVREELAGNGEVATRFAREAMATAQFEHPHVASAIDYGTLPEGGAYFVMQLVQGQSLRTVLETDGRMPWQRACRLGAQVADALSAARAANIIHRDLKPDNILVERREDGSELVKILDFGIAHVPPTDAPAPEGAMADRELTRVGTVMGTPGYMSPEQAVGDKVDHRTDLYALGVVLWECVVGSELWDGPDVTTVIARQMSERTPPLKARVDDPTLPTALDDLVLALTARDLNDRPDQAAEVRDTLGRLAVAPITRPSSLWVAIDRVQALPRASRLALLGLPALLMLLWLAWPSTGADPAHRVEPASAEEASVMEQVVGAARKAVQPAIEAVRKPGIPEELAFEVKTMLQANTLGERREAARRVQAYAHPDRVHPHLLSIAALESARGCPARKKAIRTMAQIGDERFLPALRRVQRFKKSGCGFLDLADCHSCVRRPVRDAIRTIEAATGAEPGQPDAPNRATGAARKKPPVRGAKR